MFEMRFSPLDPTLFVTEDGDVFRYGVKKLTHYRKQSGYLYVSYEVQPTGATRGKRQRKHLVHRLVASVYCGGYDKKLTVNHKNGIKTDNRVENLEWVSLTDNIKHGWATGLYTGRGSKHHNSRLTNDVVLEIRARLLAGERGCAVAAAYGIGRSQVSAIRVGKSWAHLDTGELRPAAKLTVADVVAIRRLGASGVPSSVIAARYGVTRSYINRIKSRACWANIP